jgi:hypothetical protein
VDGRDIKTILAVPSIVVMVGLATVLMPPRA